MTTQAQAETEQLAKMIEAEQAAASELVSASPEPTGNSEPRSERTPRDSRVIAGVDHDLIAQVGDAAEGRQAVNYPTYMALAAKNVNLSQFSVKFHSRPNKQGQRVIVHLPADKFQKWFGEGYMPVDYVEPTPPAPTMWSQSMVEDAIMEGRAIPSSMTPPGYAGPVFKMKNTLVDKDGNPLPSDE